MMFNHCGGPSFWADLYELADRSKSIIFRPSKQSMYVYTNESSPKEVPEGAFESGRLVRNSVEIAAAFEQVDAPQRQAAGPYPAFFGAPTAIMRLP